jgi:hypothetical protein
MAHIKSSLHSQTFNSTELNSIILMSQFLYSQAHILVGWRLETQLTRCCLFSVIQLPSQETQLVWDPFF